MRHQLITDLTVDELAHALAFLAPGAGAELIADGDAVYLVRWDSATPIPTAQQLRDAVVAGQAAREQAVQDASALRQRVMTLAQTAVGIRVNDLTAGQVRALLALLLWRTGALDREGNVRALDQWTR